MIFIFGILVGILLYPGTYISIKINDVEYEYDSSIIYDKITNIFKNIK